MTPVLGAVRGGFRRRVPVLVTGLVLLVSSAASVLGLALAVDSNAPFDQAFAAQRGADAVVTAAGHGGRAGRDQAAARGDRGGRAVRRGDRHGAAGRAAWAHACRR